MKFFTLCTLLAASVAWAGDESIGYPEDVQNTQCRGRESCRVGSLRVSNGCSTGQCSSWRSIGGRFEDQIREIAPDINLRKSSQNGANGRRGRTIMTTRRGEEVRRATVRTACGDVGSLSLGSGQIIGRIGSDLAILTCGHTMSAGEDVHVTFATGEVREATLVAMNRRMDLAVLQAPWVRGVTAVQINFEIQDYDAKFVHIGFGGDGVFFAGRAKLVGVTSASHDGLKAKGKRVPADPRHRYQVGSQLQFSPESPIQAGDSGGGAYNSSGQLVGVVWGSGNAGQELYTSSPANIVEFLNDATVKQQGGIRWKRTAGRNQDPFASIENPVSEDTNLPTLPMAPTEITKVFPRRRDEVHDPSEVGTGMVDGRQLRRMVDNWVSENADGLRGPPGQDGSPGKDGLPGKDGKPGEPGVSPDPGEVAEAIYRKYGDVLVGPAGQMTNEQMNAIVEGVVEKLGASVQLPCPPGETDSESQKNVDDTHEMLQGMRFYVRKVDQHGNFHGDPVPVMANGGFLNLHFYHDPEKPVKPIRQDEDSEQ